jgi:hypothetical protein
MLLGIFDRALLFIHIVSLCEYYVTSKAVLSLGMLDIAVQHVRSERLKTPRKAKERIHLQLE